MYSISDTAISDHFISLPSHKLAFITAHSHSLLVTTQMGSDTFFLGTGLAFNNQRWVPYIYDFLGWTFTTINVNI